MGESLRRGIEAFERHAWDEAFAHLCEAETESALPARDLERLAVCAYLTGRDDEYLAILERAHQSYAQFGAAEPAARCAFWLGLELMFHGDRGRASGWFARAERLVENHDCVEHGYLLLPSAESQLQLRRFTDAEATARDATAIGERFGDNDLVSCARHIQGRALIEAGNIHDGLSLLDETMVAVTSGELSPIVTGLIYCSVIDACQNAFIFDRAREWTTAFAEWCKRQHQMIAFTETCLVHRAEILRLQGAWSAAIEETRRACERSSGATGSAFYELAELHRLRGNSAEAEAAYRRASRAGRDPQPGLALLWLAQGRPSDAAAAVRTAIAATTEPLSRVSLLPAFVDIALEIGEVSAAANASRELDSIALEIKTEALVALAAQARGAVLLAENDAEAAVAPLRSACRIWQQLEAPYPSARTRCLIALACLALGDEAGAILELEAARATFSALGAVPDRARVDAIAPGTARAAHGLSARELEVLRLLATGKTNKAIANELSLSERTIERHVSNLFSKLDVPTRAAATAYAYRHKLV